MVMIMARQILDLLKLSCQNHGLCETWPKDLVNFFHIKAVPSKVLSKHERDIFNVIIMSLAPNVTVGTCFSTVVVQTDPD